MMLGMVIIQLMDILTFFSSLLLQYYDCSTSLRTLELGKKISMVKVGCVLPERKSLPVSQPSPGTPTPLHSLSQNASPVTLPHAFSNPQSQQLQAQPTPMKTTPTTMTLSTTSTNRFSRKGLSQMRKK